MQNKAEIPPEMQPNNARPERSSVFGFSGNITMVSYAQSRGKAVVHLSTMHHTATTEGEEDKPEIVLHYNKTKSGVNNMDHLATIFYCRRKNNQWSMVLFYIMLDVAEVAAFVIWISLNPDWSFNDRQGRRNKFLKQLGQKLTNAYIQIQLQTQSCLKSNVRNALKIIGKLDDLPQPAPAPENRPRKCCRLCPTQINKKTPGVCNICHTNVCPAHSSKVVMFTCVDYQ